MCPHPQYFYCPFGFVNLVDQTVFNINAPRVSAGKVSHKPFVRRRVFEGVGAKNIKERVGTDAKAGGLNLFRIFVRVPRKNKLPFYHGIFFEHLATGVFMSLITDSRMPGIERR